MSSQYLVWPPSLNGVTSLNGLNGDVTLLAGTGITITPSGSNITIASTGFEAFPILAPDGTAAAPSYAFTNSPSTGIYSSAANQLAFTTNGVNAGLVTSTGGWAFGSTGSGSSTVHSAYVGNAASAGASLRFQVVPTDSGGFASIGRTVNDGVMALVSDVNAPAVNSGAGLYVYGSTHATKANVTEFYNAGSLTGSISAAGAWVTTGTSTAASFIPTSSTVPANGMYLSAANTVGFSTNTALAGSINASQVWDIGTSTGQQTIEGGLIIKNVKNVVQAVIVNGASTYTGSNHYGFSVTGSTNVSNTAAYGLYSQQTTAASSATTISSNYFADGVVKGAAASLTNHVEFLSSASNRNATNNAVLTDSPIFTGNYGINLSTSNPSIITGPTAIGGTITNNSASAGFVGEYIESVISTATNVPGATTVWGNMTSISLTAGDWEVTLNVNFVNNGATVETFAFAAISINSGVTTTDQVIGSNQQSTFVPTSSRDSFVAISNYRLSFASTTTVYAKCDLDYATGNPQYRCRISARRMR